MRHRVAGRRLGRTGEHRLAMRRNLVASLVQHETISTTPEKAKEVKAFAEKLITLAKKGTLSARRRAIALLGNRDIIAYEDGKAVKKGTIIGKLFSELGPRYLDRPGGYTRIICLSLRRLGDNSQLVLLQFVGEDKSTKKQTRAATRKAARKKARKTVEPKGITQADEAVEAEEGPNKDEETTEVKSEENESNKQQ
jgi:large subunit ribosomal protein L17